MREVDEEIREIKKEIIESRGLVIKTNNLTSSLGADIKAIAKRQAAHERRTWWNSVVAYGMLGALCVFGFKLLLDVSVQEMELEKQHLSDEADRLRTELEEEVRRAEARATAEAKALAFYELVKANKRPEAIERFATLEKEQLSPAERAMFADVIKRFEAELAVEAYQAGLGLVRTGRFSEAMESFEDAMRLDPSASHVPTMKYYMGLAQQKLGKPVKAKELLEEVLAQGLDKSMHTETTWLISHVHEELDDLDAARDAMRSLMRKWPRSEYFVDARKRLGELNLKAMRAHQNRNR